MACLGDAISYSLDEFQLMDTCGENIFPFGCGVDEAGYLSLRGAFFRSVGANSRKCVTALRGHYSSRRSD